MPTAVTEVRFLLAFVCLSVHPHDISETAAAKITKLDTKMFHHKFRKPIYFGSKDQRSRSRGTKSAVVGFFCIRMSAGFFCGFIIQASNCRTWDTCWAEIRIFYTDEVADADAKATDVMLTAYSELMTLALEYVVTMDVGYSDCIVRVASSCRLRYDVARRHDFVVIATIPNSVDMAGLGLCDDFIFAKSLQLNDRPVSVC